MGVQCKGGGGDELELSETGLVGLELKEENRPGLQTGRALCTGLVQTAEIRW